MEDLVNEMYEEFIMSEACSRYYALLGEEDSEAQDLTTYLNYIDHMLLCEKGAKICKNFLKTKDEARLLLELRRLRLYHNITCIIRFKNIQTI